MNHNPGEHGGSDHKRDTIITIRKSGAAVKCHLVIVITINTCDPCPCQTVCDTCENICIPGVESSAQLTLLETLTETGDRDDSECSLVTSDSSWPGCLVTRAHDAPMVGQ